MAENRDNSFKTDSETTAEDGSSSDSLDHNSIQLEIVSRSGTVADIKCSSVQLNVADDEKGNGGGGFGIYPNCIRSVIQLCEGKIIACQDGEKIFETDIPGGFATVDNNKVTVISDG